MPEKPRRMPTEYIPNSPDTLQTVTREATRLTSTPIAAGGDAVAEEILPAPKEPLMKFASVYLRSHEGIPSESPYNIKNKQMVIITSVKPHQ